MKTVIGLEVHVVADTTNGSESLKAFSHASTEKVSWSSSGFIGVLPQVNPHFIKQGIRLSNILGMTVSPVVLFDRKHYFYLDLPRGYQITQEREPLGRDGVISSGKKSWKISRLQLEEDSAKQIIKGKVKEIDLIRLGLPVIELVTDPIFFDSREVIEFLTTLKKICIVQRISKMRAELGEFRVDLNISIESNGVKSCRHEVKNLNSLDAIGDSIEAVVERLKSNSVEPSKTFNWKNGALLDLRSKETHYFFTREDNIPPILVEGIVDKQLIVDVMEGLDEKKVSHLLKTEKLRNLYWEFSLSLNHFQAYDWATTLYRKLSDWEGDLKDILVVLINEEWNKTEKMERIEALLGGKSLVDSQEIDLRGLVENILKDPSTKKENLKKLESFVIGTVMKSFKGRVSIDAIKATLTELNNL